MSKAQDAPEDLLALERQVCFALAVASRTVIAMYKPLLEPMGLTHPQYLVLLALWGREPQSVRELSDALLLDPATMSPLLKRLESTGLIARRRQTADERHLAVTLTDAGRALRAEAEKIPVSIIQQLEWSIDDLDDIRERLTALTESALLALGTGRGARPGDVGSATGDVASG